MKGVKLRRIDIMILIDIILDIISIYTPINQPDI